MDDYTRLLGYCRECEETGCLEWIGGFTGKTKTVPLFHYSGTRKNRRCSAAYKAAWLLSGKKIPKGHWVYRKCLNFKCVNVEHCTTGTPSAMFAYIAKSERWKGHPQRMAANSRNRAAQRTSEPVIRQAEQMLATGAKRIEVAAALGVSIDVVTDVKQGRHFHSSNRPRVVRGASVFAL